MDKFPLMFPVIWSDEIYTRSGIRDNFARFIFRGVTLLRRVPSLSFLKISLPSAELVNFVYELLVSGLLIFMFL